jgi:hypothetical protein
MPTPYVFVICEKVILEQSNVASLISLFTQINIDAAAEIPPNAVVPKEWAIFVSWDWEPSDAGREYTNRIQILHPDGTVFLEIPPVAFTMQEGRKQQVNTPVLGIPIGQLGRCAVRLWLEHAGVVVIEPRSIYLEVKRNPPRVP